MHCLLCMHCGTFVPTPLLAAVFGTCAWFVKAIPAAAAAAGLQIGLNYVKDRWAAASGFDGKPVDPKVRHGMIYISGHIETLNMNLNTLLNPELNLQPRAAASGFVGKPVDPRCGSMETAIPSSIKHVWSMKHSMCTCQSMLLGQVLLAF
jgi:hypothetical protein